MNIVIINGSSWSWKNKIMIPINIYPIWCHWTATSTCILETNEILTFCESLHFRVVLIFVNIHFDDLCVASPVAVVDAAPTNFHGICDPTRKNLVLQMSSICIREFEVTILSKIVGVVNKGSRTGILHWRFENEKEKGDINA